MKNFRFSKKSYLVAFVFVMSLNVCLGIFLVRNVLAQTSNDQPKNQLSVVAEVAEQKDSPLRIIIVNVDNSSSSHQEIICSLQNISNKSITGYTLLANSKSSGKIITSFFLARTFRAGESIIESIPIERLNIKEGETFSIFIDYIKFDDGSFWGNDSREKSKEIAGQREGAKEAIKQLKELIKNQNVNSAINITDFLKKDLQDIPIDTTNINQPEEWKKAFRLGYRTVISILQNLEEKKIENLTKKLDELEKNIN